MFGDLREGRIQGDVDLEVPLKDLGINVVIFELNNYLSLLSLKFLNVNLEVTKYINLDNVKVSPTFNLNVDMENWLDSSDAFEE